MLAGVEVCHRGFKRLLSLGSHRYQRLSAACRGGALDCPLDGRMIAQMRVKPPSEKRMKVFEFLEWMWRTCAEPVPDEYASSKMPHKLAAGKQKKKKNCEGVRQLPPGSLQDYYKLCVAEYPEENISYNLWSSVSGTSIVDLRLFHVAFHQVVF